VNLSNKDLWGPPKVGGDVLSYCARCKMELAHVIVSMVDGHPAKVMCKTCRSEHRFKRASSMSPSPRAARSPRPLKTVITASKLWEQKMAENKKPTRSYDVKASFVSGDLINHDSFGVGLVEEVKGKKMVVLFRDGEKVLIHAQT
jgi:hypothetical protein